MLTNAFGQGSSSYCTTWVIHLRLVNIKNTKRRSSIKQHEHTRRERPPWGALAAARLGRRRVAEDALDDLRLFAAGGQLVVAQVGLELLDRQAAEAVGALCQRRRPVALLVELGGGGVDLFWWR